MGLSAAAAADSPSILCARHQGTSSITCLQVSEERLIELLEQVNQQAGGGKTRVTIQRRRTGMDDDDF